MNPKTVMYGGWAIVMVVAGLVWLASDFELGKLLMFIAFGVGSFLGVQAIANRGPKT